MNPNSVERSAIPVRHVLHWYESGLRLWWKRPLTLLLMCLSPLIFEFLIQLIPWLGVIVSKLLTPVVGAGVILGIDRLARGEALQLRQVAWGFHPRHLPRLLLLNLYLMIVFVIDLVAVAMAFGLDTAAAVMLGHVTPAMHQPGFLHILILPGLIPITMLGYATPLLVLEGLSPMTAVRRSVRWSIRSWRAVGMLGLLTGLLFAASLSLPFALLLILAAAPLMTAAGYASYRELAGDAMEFRSQTIPVEA